MNELYTTQEEEQKVEYTTGAPARVPLEGDRLNRRAQKIDFVLGEQSPGIETIAQDLASGTEEPYQEQIVQKEMGTRLDTAKQLVMDNVLANPEADPARVALLADTGTPPDKETVVEEQFAKKAMDAIMAATSSEAVEKAMQENPMGFDKKFQVYEEIIFKNLITQKHKAEVDQMVSNMGWGSYIAGFGAQLFEYPSWANIITNTEGVPESSAWSTPGALRERVMEIRALPPVEMDRAIRAEVASLASINPLDAQTFINAMSSYAASQGSIDLIGNLSMLPIGTAAKAPMKAAEVIGKNVKAAQDIAAAVDKTKTVAKAAEPVEETIEQTAAKQKAAYESREYYGPEVEELKRKASPAIRVNGKVYSAETSTDWRKAKTGEAHISAVEAALEKGVSEEAINKAMEAGDFGYFIDIGDGIDFAFVKDSQLFPKKARVKDPVDAELEAISKAVSAPSTDIPTIMSGTGKIATASEIAMREHTAVRLMRDGPDALKRQFSEMLRRVPSLWNPKVYVNDGDNLFATRADDLITFQERAVDLLIGMGKTARVSRLPEEIWNEAAEMAVTKIKDLYKSVEDNILEVRKIMPGDSPLNVGQIAVTFGKQGKEAFEDFATADKAIKLYGLPRNSTVVKNVGGRYVLETYADVGEDKVANLILTPENKPRNNSWTFLKSLAGSKQQASEFQSAQRAAAAQTETALGMMARELYAPYEKLGKRSRKALDEIMRVNQNTEAIPGDPKTRGMFYRNGPELERGFMRNLGRLPTADEVEAYFAVVRASDIDWIYRSFNEYTRKASQGFENVTVTRLIKDGELAENTFEGRLVDDFPIETRDNIDVTWIDEDYKVHQFNMAKITDETRGQIALLKEQGYKVVQAYNPRDENVFKTAGSDKPNPYIITRDVKQAPLRLDKQVNYRPGFHNEYKSEWYVKQPRVLHGRFEGDTTALGFRTEAEAVKYAPRMEKARVLLKEGKTAELNKYLKDNLPHTYDEFKKMFDEQLDIDTPFVVVKKNTRSASAGRLLENGSDFATQFGKIDSSLDELYNPSALFGDPFTATRDPLVSTIKAGSEDKPLYELDTAELLSPMLGQTKAMGSLIKSTLYNDYQLTSASNYIEEFGKDLLYEGKPVTIETLRRNPVFYLANGELNFKTNPKRYAQAQQLKMAIENLIGTPSVYAEALDMVKQKTLSGIYNRFGEKYLDYVPDAAIPMIKEPLSYLRSVAFHTKLGMFNPVQFFVQASAVVNTVAISPIHGTASFAGSLAMRALTLTASDDIIKKTAEHVAKFPGWTKEKFIDSKKMMDQFGFDRIGSETAWRNDMGDPTLYRGAVGQLFLDKGPMFFNAGERAVRLTAWNTAYLEFAEKFPAKIGKFNEYDAKKILSRAQDLSANMTRDNNSFWQNGIAGNFTQFWSYNVRMAELMMGKQLTKAEKARLILTQATLWGVSPLAAVGYAMKEGDPSALMTTTPYGEDLAVHAARNGQNIEAGTLGMIYHGMVSTIFEAITGEKVDFGSRYGMSPIKVMETIKRNFDENNPVRALVVSMLGPSGSITNDIIKESSNIAGSMYDLVLGDGAAGNLLPMDIANALREISTVNTATKMYYAGTGGVYVSQNGNVITKDGDPPVEIMKALFGVQGADEAFAYNVLEAMKNEEKSIESTKKYMKRVQAQYLQARRSGNKELAADLFNKMAAMLAVTKLSHNSKLNILYPEDDQEVSDILLEDFINGVEDIDDRAKIREAIEQRNAE